ncbi:MAG: hypothetical protein FJX77_05870 [Armatimonadetes bacterium]|nr:hypothetical protein [Armatimonadota bacterium]
MTTPEPGYLLQLREELFGELEEAELALSRVRMRVERLESDLRIGRPEPTGFSEEKGHTLPRAETRVMDLFQQLLKLEERIRKAGR